MKTKLLLAVTGFILLAGSCTKKDSNPLEGAWRLVYSEWPGHSMTFPDRITGSSIKFFSSEHFAYAGMLLIDDVPMHYLGGGRYYFEGNRYTEFIDYHRSEDIIGTSVRIIKEIRGDTLIQRWPADENWELCELVHTQKYVRMK